MFGVLWAVSTTAVAGEVTFKTTTGDPAKVSVVDFRLTTTDGQGAVATSDLCITPCTMDIPEGLYTFKVDQPNHLLLESTIEIGTAASTITFPETRHVAPFLGAALCCFPIALYMMIDRSAGEVRVTGDAEVAW